MNYLVQNGQTIFDVVINTILDLNKTYALIIENPTIKNIASVPIGLNVNYTQADITPPTLQATATAQPSEKKSYLSQTNQTIFDVVLQTYGDLNNTYKLVKESTFPNIITYPPPLRIFTFNERLIKDTVFYAYLKNNGIIINTGTGLPGGSFSTGSYNDDYSDDYDN